MKVLRNCLISVGIFIVFCFGEFIKYIFINWEKYLGSFIFFLIMNYYNMYRYICICICSYINNCYFSLKKKR